MAHRASPSPSLVRRAPRARGRWPDRVAAQVLPAGPRRIRRRDGPGHGRRLGRRGQPRRHRVLQLHRLRAQRAADVPRVAVAGMWRPTDRLAVLTEFRSEDVAARASRTRSTCASGRGRRVPFDIQAGRIPPVFGVFARRSYGADNPLIGYPARLPVPHVAPARRHAGHRRRSAGDAGPRLARELSGRDHRLPSPGVPLVTRLSMGHRASRGICDTAHVEAAARSRRARCRTRASATTTAAGRSPAASPGSRSSAW